MDKVMIDGNALGFKSNDISVHFSRQEAAYMVTALESATDEVIENFLREKMEWKKDKREAYLAESQGIRQKLINRIQLIVVLEGG
jgi:hypothetical protein